MKTVKIFLAILIPIFIGAAIYFKESKAVAYILSGVILFGIGYYIFKTRK